jgi:hypothetical protein
MTLRIRLVDRILQARGRKHLRALLKQAKGIAGKDAKFTTSGDDDALRKSVGEALAGNFVSDTQLMALADRLEEIGGQHIYLFKLTPAGKAALTSEKMKVAFSRCVPSPDYYTDTPSGAAVEWVERDGAVFLKQVLTTSFWERDRLNEIWNDEVRQRTWRRVSRRAVNTCLIDCEAGTAELCIDRVTGENDATLADEELSKFFTALAPFLVIKDHLVPVRISHAFARIVAETRDEAYMNADSVDTSTVAQRISNRRKGTKLPDVRGNVDYVRAKPKGDREGLTIYWFTDQAAAAAKAKEDAEYEDDEDDAEDEGADSGTSKRPYVHSIITAVTRKIEGQSFEHCKVYISAKITEQARAHVISRIRHFAG